eukprot:GHVP01062371.1.p1 GENE.GHVP01062371.1~~GHVP01062371.1.p1  ORF type:complete len:723 (+),score=128.86 GHVP01062371.1:386-2554(+)
MPYNSNPTQVETVSALDHIYPVMSLDPVKVEDGTVDSPVVLLKTNKIFSNWKSYQDIFLPSIVEELFYEVSSSLSGERGRLQFAATKSHQIKQIASSEKTGKYTILKFQLKKNDPWKVNNYYILKPDSSLFSVKIKDLSIFGIAIKSNLKERELSFAVRDLDAEPYNSLQKLPETSPAPMWTATLLGCVSTTLNEIKALMFGMLEESLFRDHILGSGIIIDRPHPYLKQEFEDLVRAKLNLEQHNAIKKCLLLKKGIFSIHGPPGTGKTTTILAVLSCFLRTVEYKESISGLRKSFCDKILDYENPPPRITRVDPTLFRIAVCAPSNGATDEILRRFVDSEKNPFFFDLKDMIARLGSNCSDDVYKWTLDGLLGIPRPKLDSEGNREFRPEKSDTGYKKKLLVSQKVIYFGTLASFSSTFLKGNKPIIDLVIVDEASTATEPSLLIPLQYGCSRLILVGDHKQLPPSINSLKNEKHGLKRSFFERFAEIHGEPHLLNVQYRMHPVISRYISKRFYENKIKDSITLLDTCTPPEVGRWWQDSRMKPLVFFDVRGTERQDEYGLSYSNEIEANFILEKLKFLKDKIGNEGISKIGIITPYEAQKELLRKKLSFFKAVDVTEESRETNILEIGTVDGFQGREKDFIIISCVRSNTLGFLKDRRRLNVAISRARLNVWAIGHFGALSRDSNWKELARHAAMTESALVARPNIFQTEICTEEDRFLV